MGVIKDSLKLGNRERMIRTCLNQDIDRLPFWFMFGPWTETLERWQKEGLKGGDWTAPFGLDTGFVGLPVNLGYHPYFPVKILHEDEERRTVQNEYGITFIEKKGHSTIPMYIDYPVKSRSDWETLKRERLDPHEPKRFPDNWKEVITSIKESDAAVQIGRYPFGLFGTLRDFMGVEELLIAFYDEPELIHEIMGYLTDFWITIYKKVLEDIQIDHIHIWEDMSGKQGPLISPAMFREFMMPHYKRIVVFAKQNQIPVVSVDTDGNMDVLMPLLAESGINMVLPFEVQAGCDVVVIREQFPNVSLHGGIDKRMLALDFAAIDKELERISCLLDKSGYIPSLDHLPHPEISYSNFCYFIEKLKVRLGVKV